MNVYANKSLVNTFNIKFEKTFNAKCEKHIKAHFLFFFTHRARNKFAIIYFTDLPKVCSHIKNGFLLAADNNLEFF